MRQEDACCKLVGRLIDSLSCERAGLPAAEEVGFLRGVASGEIIRSLMYKGLVKILGRAEVIGRPLLYGTTKKFLEVFGLNSLKDLPNADELKKPE